MGCSFKIENSDYSCPKMDSRTFLNHMTTHSSGKNIFKIGRCKKVFDQAGNLNNCKFSHSILEKSHTSACSATNVCLFSHLRDAWITRFEYPPTPFGSFAKIHPNLIIQVSHDYSHWREIAQVCTLQQVIRKSWTFEKAFTHPFSG